MHDPIQISSKPIICLCKGLLGFTQVDILLSCMVVYPSRYLLLDTFFECVFDLWMKICVCLCMWTWTILYTRTVKNRSNNSVAASCRAYANNDSGRTQKRDQTKAYLWWWSDHHHNGYCSCTHHCVWNNLEIIFDICKILMILQVHR